MNFFFSFFQEKLTNTFREATAKMKEQFSSIMAKAELEAEEAAKNKELDESVDIAEVHSTDQKKPIEDAWL